MKTGGGVSQRSRFEIEKKYTSSGRQEYLDSRREEINGYEGNLNTYETACDKIFQIILGVMKSVLMRNHWTSIVPKVSVISICFILTVCCSVFNLVLALRSTSKSVLPLFPCK